jgi:hypothetical protein
MADTIRRSATTGGKPRATDPIDFSKYRKRKPKDPKDIAQVGGHDRFAEEQALHGVDVPQPQSTTDDDDNDAAEHNSTHERRNGSPHNEEHSRNSASQDHPIRSSNPNAQYIGAHKTPNREKAAKHYQDSMRRFETESCSFREVEPHTSKYEHEYKGQDEAEHEHKQGSRKENTRCTGAHKIVDKKLAAEHYKASCEGFMDAGYSFHDAEYNANSLQHSEEMKDAQVRKSDSHQPHNKRHSGAHKWRLRN